MRTSRLAWFGVLALGCGGGDATIGDAGSDGNTMMTVDSGGGGMDGATDTGGGNDGSMTSDASDSGGGGDAGGDSGGGDSGSDSGGGDGGMKYTGRMFVSMTGNAPGVWENSSSITMDVAPTFTLSDSSVTSGTRGVTVAGKRLFFGAESNANMLIGFDNAAGLMGNTPAAAKVPQANFITPPSGNASAHMLQWDAKTDSLWVSSQNGTQHFASAATITSMSKAKALFWHAWQQLPGAAYDPGGDRLFLGQISGAGVLAWNGATGAMNMPAVSYTLDKTMAAWSEAVDNDRLYAVGPYTGGGNQKLAIAVWKGISSVSSSKVPDFVLSNMSGLAANDFSPYITVNSDVLIACIQAGKVLLWKGASSLAGETMPTQTIAIGSIQNPPRKAYIGPVTGRLYVLDNTGVSIYDNPLGAPKLITKVTMGIKQPFDFAVLE